jgi:cytochrome c biogenesis protein CcmG/thiol:disulfide interchange protein DsbE
MKNVWRFIPVLVVLALAVLFFWALNRPDKEELPTALAGKPVPAFSLPALNHPEPVTEEIFQGQWTLLNVWATWCPACHLEHPYLLELADKGVAIVGLDYKDDNEAAREYLAQKGNPFIAIPVDQDGRYGLDLGVYGAPETYVVNPQGEIVLRHVGELNEAVWQRKIAPVWEGGNDAP